MDKGVRKYMKTEQVKGENKGKIFLYALSTCVWCKKTKKLLDKSGVEYSYVFVDKLDDEDQEQAKKQMINLTKRCSFPTRVINDKNCIVGFKEDKIKEALKL